jgi:poly(3-hydroxybutyrate) depolymerase
MLWNDTKGRQRVALIEIPGMGHAWAAGPGAYGSNEADYTHINYPAWVTNWFFANNIRILGKPTADAAGACFNSSNSMHISGN